MESGGPRLCFRDSRLRGTHAYAGPYSTAITQDGSIVASFITSGVLNADVIKAGVLHDENYNTMIDMVTGLATFNRLIAKNSFEVYDEDSGVNAATIMMDSDGGMIAAGDLAGSPKAYLCVYPEGGACQCYNTYDYAVSELYVDSGGAGILILSDMNQTGTIVGFGDDGTLQCVTLVQTSSRKTKENIKPMEDAAKILELEAVSFDFKNKAQGTNKRGFIAEDVAEILPNLVTPERVDEKRGTTTPAALDYVGMIPYLQTVIKDQERRIKALEERINGTDQR